MHLTDKEKAEIEDILIAAEDHSGFVNGRDVAAIARILLRIFEAPSKPAPKKAPAKKAPVSKESAE